MGRFSREKLSFMPKKQNKSKQISYTVLFKMCPSTVYKRGIYLVLHLHRGGSCPSAWYRTWYCQRMLTVRVMARWAMFGWRLRDSKSSTFSLLFCTYNASSIFFNSNRWSAHDVYEENILFGINILYPIFYYGIRKWELST